jgi:hypothetical protein
MVESVSSQMSVKCNFKAFSMATIQALNFALRGEA